MASVLGRQKYRALGVAFLALILIALYLVYAAFTQKFSHFDKVTLQTDTIGLQLPDRADVKIRGVLVGQVLDKRAAPLPFTRFDQPGPAAASLALQIREQLAGGLLLGRELLAA